MAAHSLTEFMARYNPDGTHPVTEIEAMSSGTGERHASHFIIVRHGPWTALVNPLGCGDHLCIDVHPFMDGENATAAAFGMTEGRRVQFPHTGMTSYGYPSCGLVAVLLGGQAAG